MEGSPNVLAIEWQGEQWGLMGDGAAYRFGRSERKATRDGEGETVGTLYIADVHLDKSAHFRRMGVPAPGGILEADLERLSGTIHATGARRLIVLGDLLHARHARDAAVDAAWRRFRDRHAGLEVVLVRGNHDRHAGDPPTEWDVRCADEGWLDAGFELRHEPRPLDALSRRGRAAERGGDEAMGALSGHVHPAVVLRDGDGGRVRVSSFIMQAGRQLILPAYGRFTGAAVVELEPGDRAFGIVGGEPMEVTALVMRDDPTRPSGRMRGRGGGQRSDPGQGARRA